MYSHNQVFSFTNRYPMALGNLGDCEEICETPGRPPPIDLFKEAIDSAVKFYDNYHVYPYTYLGGHYYRKGEYKQAIEAWAEASSVIKKFVIYLFTAKLLNFGTLFFFCSQIKYW